MAANTNSSLFQAKLKSYAGQLGTDPANLQKIFDVESGSNSRAVNGTSGATGLIQFMPSTARALGTTTSALKNMTPEQQLDYVFKYYKPYAGKISNLDDAYLSTFYPKAIGKPDNYTIGNNAREQAMIARQNPRLDFNGDGVITVGDVKAFLNNKYPSNQPAMMHPDQPTSDNTKIVKPFFPEAPAGSPLQKLTGGPASTGDYSDIVAKVLNNKTQQ